jgi:hypothetical protein
MRIRPLLCAAAALAASVLSPGLHARVDPLDTRILTGPAAGATHLVFI